MLKAVHSEETIEVIIQDLKTKIQEFMQIADHLLDQQHSQVQEEVCVCGGGGGCSL